jgi:hypothetical protein
MSKTLQHCQVMEAGAYLQLKKSMGQVPVHQHQQWSQVEQMLMATCQPASKCKRTVLPSQ